MATLIDLRRRIRSVENSKKITQAMKTVSTAKFRKAQRVVVESRPFWHEFPELMNRLAYWAGDSRHPLFARREQRKIETIVITSDKGLAGAFNANLLARAAAFIAEKSAEAAVRVVPIGKKSTIFFRKHAWPVDRTYADKTDKIPRVEIRDLAEFLMREYAYQKIDGVYVVYNEFKSILAPRLAVFELLPLQPDPGPGETARWQPAFEPAAARLAGFILPLFVESQLHHVLHESQAAEHAARMMAMDNATKNAEELIDDLTLVLNKIRQAGITKELLEIMTAVEALKEKA